MSTIDLLNPNPFLTVGPALGGILAVLHAAMDMKATIGGRLHRCAPVPAPVHRY